VRVCVCVCVCAPLNLSLDPCCTASNHVAQTKTFNAYVFPEPLAWDVTGGMPTRKFTCDAGAMSFLVSFTCAQLLELICHMAARAAISTWLHEPHNCA